MVRDVAAEAYHWNQSFLGDHCSTEMSKIHWTLEDGKASYIRS